MSRAPLRLVVILASFLVVPRVVCASPIQIDFESLSELDAVGSISGATFSNATVFTAGSLLNDLDFPPHSGQNVAFDDGGAIRIDFAAPVSNFSAYFTYAVPLTLQAFSASNVLLVSSASQYSANSVSFGDPGSAPNELLTLSFSNIAYVTLTGDSLGGSFVVDDVAFTTASTTPSPVPEPATISLAILGLGGIAATERRRRRCG